ncbi:MAG: bile acid:sodium symporter family protein [Mesorhizobium sp.]
MGSLLTVFLPLSLAIIMFSLGLGLTVADFRRVVSQPKAFGIGAFSQLVMIPVVAYALCILFRLPPELAVGLMILSFCPGGVTSNILTKIARGDLALSISLTGIISLVAVFTMPPLVSYFARHFMGQDAPPINITQLGITMALITAAPVILGILIRHFAPRAAIAAEPILDKLALLLFVIVVVGAIATNWALLIENLISIGPALVLLNVLLLAIGLLFGRIFSLTKGEATAIAIETGVQNATMGITVGTLIVEQASALPAFSLPSGVYGVTMYLVTIPFVLWRRNRVAG